MLSTNMALVSKRFWKSWLLEGVKCSSNELSSRRGSCQVFCIAVCFYVYLGNGVRVVVGCFSDKVTTQCQADGTGVVSDGTTI